jgi:hypothetical protein
MGGWHRAEARTIANDYPRLANVYLTPTISLSEARSLARWDTLILGLEVQYTSPDSLKLIRQLNPDIIILAYVLSEEIPDSQFYITDPNHPHYQLVHNLPNGWWLRDAQGGRVSFWPGSHMVNVTPAAPVRDGEHWYEYLARFMHEKVLATGYWDGIFYDNAFKDISWINNGNLDINNDGQAESASQLDQSWRDGMSELLRQSRRWEGGNTLIIGNGAEAYLPLVNGRLIEEFPSAYDHYWPGAMQKYADAADQSTLPTLVIINSRTTTGTASDYRQMRFNLCSTLLRNGFASFDYGSLRHADLWWYDEYDTYLGQPQGAAKNLLHPAKSGYEASVWRREFTNAVVLVNSTAQARKVELGGGFERLNGLQDRSVNNGAITTSVWIQPNDGIILLKKQINVHDGEYINGALGLAFDEQGRQQRQGFFTTNSNFAGGTKVITRDINTDGNLETIVGWNNKVQIYNSGGFLMREIYPYGKAYHLGVNIAVGDLDGDGTAEIITGTGRGAGPQVRIYTSGGRLLNPGFFAYDPKFRGGVNVAIGDLNGDGRSEIIAGSGFGGGPQVRIFNPQGKAIGGFFAYDKKFRGGVTVAAGDINADGRAEIVTAPGPGGGPQVRIFNGQGKALTPGFYAYAKTFRTGISVTIADVNNDGVADILVSAPTIY